MTRMKILSEFITCCLLVLHHTSIVSTHEENTTSTTLDSLCDNDGICENASSILKFNITHENDYDEEEVLKNFLNISTFKPSPRTTVEPSVEFEPRIKTIKHVSGLRECSCDLLPEVCDINCCCDQDCQDYHLTSFSHCSDNYRISKLYDHRYCYRKNFIKKNRTDFILERLADNLFCIAYDNLPPIYSSINTIDIKNRKNFEEVFDTHEHDRYPSFKWDEEKNANKNVEKLRINFPYIHGDPLWKYANGEFKTVEIPSTGFTKQCSHLKTLRYLENFESSCLQTNLTDANEFLFIKTYTNIAIISNSIYIKNMTLKDNECPKNICISVEMELCKNSHCNLTFPKSSCSDNICENIVKRISYTIYHNGTAGIDSIKAIIEIGNISRNYHQHFRVKYQWIDKINETIVERSGNPGYNIGKPIIIGTLSSSNITKSNVFNKILINTNNSVLTVPLADRNGNCIENDKFVIGFGDNIKSKCIVSVSSSNFSSKTCSLLQDKIIKILFRDTLKNVTQIDNYKIYISRSSNTSYNITNWIQIYLNKLPRSVNNGVQFNERKISCSGLIKSMKIDILYSVLPKTDSKENYKIIGVGFTLNDDEDFYWDKCNYENCTDTLTMELNTYVMFYDISTPSMYYYAGGPNLDISLPYDFFYPFLSGNAYSSGFRNEFSIVYCGLNYLILYLLWI